MEEIKIDESKLKSEFYELKIKDMISEYKKELDVVQKDDSIDKVLYLLKDFQHVWVVDSEINMKLLGVINRVDLLHLLAPPKSIYHIFSLPKSYHQGTIGVAEDIMDTDFITCEDHDKIVTILKKMIRHTTEKLALISEDGRLTGEVNLKSMIHHYYEAKKDSLQNKE
jgi:predicted transcriptional regulator